MLTFLFSIIHKSIYLSIHPFVHSFIHLSIHSLIHSPTHSLTHSLTHSILSSIVFVGEQFENGIQKAHLLEDDEALVLSAMDTFTDDSLKGINDNPDYWGRTSRDLQSILYII